MVRFIALLAPPVVKHQDYDPQELVGDLDQLKLRLGRAPSAIGSVLLPITMAVFIQVDPLISPTAIDGAMGRVDHRGLVKNCDRAEPQHV